MEGMSFGVAFFSALILFVVTVLISFSTLYGRTSGGGGILAAPLGDPDGPLFVAILLRNSAVALSLFAGTLTIGISSLVGVASLGFLVGASTAAGATEVGMGIALSSVIGYAVIELPAFLLAATAGLLPGATVLFPSRRLSGTTAFSRYLAPLRTSLSLLGISLALITIGAGVETLIITSRNG